MRQQRSSQGTTRREWFAIAGFFLALFGVAQGGSLFMTDRSASSASGTIDTQVDSANTLTTATLNLAAGTNITLQRSDSGMTRTVTITGATQTFSGDFDSTTQKYANNSGSSFGGALQVRDVLELNNTTATAPTTVTAASGALTINVDGAAGRMSLTAGDDFAADQALHDIITARTAATALALRETSGITMADDSNTAATISTFTPGTNALTLAIAGTGTFTIDATDRLSVNAITGNGAGVEVQESTGLLIGNDSGLNSSSLVATAGVLTLNVNGTGAFTLTAGDKIIVDQVDLDTIATRAGGALAIKETSGLSLQLDAGTNGTTLVPAAGDFTLNVDGSGTFTLTAGDTLRADVLETTTDNTTLTLRGRGTGGVSVGTEAFSFANLSGAGGADANGDIPVRDTVAGVASYRRLGIGLENQLLASIGGFPVWTTATSVNSAITVQESDVTVVLSASVVDFLGTKFDVTETLVGEANITLAANGVTAVEIEGGAPGASGAELADSVTNITSNTTLTLVGAGAGGVSVGTEAFSFANLDGAGGVDAKGDIAYRDAVTGVAKYTRLAIGSTDQALTVLDGKPAYQYPITATVTTTGYRASSITLLRASGSFATHPTVTVTASFTEALVASSTAIAGDTTAETFFNNGAIPVASDEWRVGRAFRIHGAIRFTSDADADLSSVVRLYLGSTVIQTLGSFGLTASLTNAPIVFDSTVVCRATGGSGVAQTYTYGILFPRFELNSYGVYDDLITTGVVTNVDQNFRISWDWGGTSDADDSAVLTGFTVY